MRIWKLSILFLFLLFFQESMAVVLSGKNSIRLERFERADKLPFDANMHPSINWFQIHVDNQSDESWVLEFVDFTIDSLSVYIPTDKGKGYEKYFTGRNFLFSSRAFQHKNFVFNLPRNNKAYTIYFAIPASKFSPVYTLKVNIRTLQNIAEYGFQEYAFLMFFYGIIFCMALYNLFHYVFTRAPLHALYVCYVFSLSLFSLSRIDGLGFEYLWPNMPSINSFICDFSLGLFVASGIVFAAYFLRLKKTHPFSQRFLLIYAVVRVLISLVPAIHNSILDPKLIDLPILVFVFIIGIRKKTPSKSPSRFFLAGYLAMVLGFSVYTFQDVDFIKNSFSIYYSLNFGVILESILLSIALSERTKSIIVEKQNAQLEVIEQLQNNETLQEQLIKELQEKEALKDKVNRELAQKVKERTLELEAKNQLLNEQNQKIEKLASQIDLQYFSLKKEAQKKELEHVWNKHLSYEEFLKLYPTEASCLVFLEKEKWPEGFTCVKCNYEHYTRNQTNLSRKCNRCSHIESVTANTVYHGIHIPIQKAMYIAHCVIHGMDKINVSEFAKTIDLRLNTCRAYIEKVQAFRTSNKKG